jgi:hypothetical protein
VAQPVDSPAQWLSASMTISADLLTDAEGILEVGERTSESAYFIELRRNLKVRRAPFSSSRPADLCS